MWFSVNSRRLNPWFELKKFYGPEVIDFYEGNRRLGNVQKLKGFKKHKRRLSLLVSPSLDWVFFPWSDGYLSMEILYRKNQTLYFGYVLSQSYICLQDIFERARDRCDFETLIYVLGCQPYHIDSLLLFAKMFMKHGQKQLFSDAIEKCLFGLEMAWHSKFDPSLGTCKAPYSYDPNKPLFHAIFYHIRSLDRPGCYQTALELCKFLYSLDDSDPMGVLFCIDYYSLRAHQYSWLVDHFSTEYWMFPNFAYSLAVCHFHLEKGDYRQKRTVTSICLMVQALKLYPLVLKRLADKVPFKDKAWKEILEHPFFSSSEAGGPTLDRLISIYINRSYVIWLLPVLQNFLKEAAILVIDIYSNSFDDIEYWAEIRTAAFSPQKIEFSHLKISDFSDYPFIRTIQMSSSVYRRVRKTAAFNPSVLFKNSIFSLPSSG